jgi:hypothetical protein
MKVTAKNHQIFNIPDVAIAIRQPWANAILYGCEVITESASEKFRVPIGGKAFKFIENRTWLLPERYESRPVFLYASKRYDRGGANWIEAQGLKPSPRKECELGKIVGIIQFSKPILFGKSSLWTLNNPWQIRDNFQWKIDFSLHLLEPFEIESGRLGFFKFKRV